MTLYLNNSKLNRGWEQLQNTRPWYQFTWYQNEFHSGMSFVPEWSSYCIHMTKSTGSAVLKTKTIKQYACLTRPRIHGLRFHLGTEFVFSLHDTRMKCHTRTRISFGLKTGMNSFRKDLCGDEISSRYHVNRYREIYGDGMNSFWNESHSGIMWTAPKFQRRCLQV